MAKAMGLVAGSADYVFCADGFAGWIELKSPVGSLNPAQKGFRDWCAGQNVSYAICRSMSEVGATLTSWGLLT